MTSLHNRRSLLFSLFVLVLLFLFCLAGCKSWLEPVQRQTTEEHTGEIRGERTVGQTFVAQHDGLHAVEILLATFARSNTQPLTFHLRATPQSDVDLRTVTVSAAEIKDNAYHRFSFVPISDSHHQRYYFCIDSPQSRSGDAITAWIGPADSYREGSLYMSGQAREGQLAFKLEYDNFYIAWGLVRDLVCGLPVGLAAVMLFVLPGLTLVSWLAPAWRWHPLLTSMVSTALSAAIFPLLLLFSRPLGLHWGPALTWAFLLLCLGLGVWRWQRLIAKGIIVMHWSGWRDLLRRPRLETWLFLIVAGLVLSVRWLVVRPLSVPMWGDSHQHTYIAQLLVENGGLFDSWEPYAPYKSLTVHFGFHAVVAFFHWATGVGILRAVILVGQIFNGLAVLALYPLAVRISSRVGRSCTKLEDARGRWAGILAVVVAGLLMSMPMEYVNWGRYPQLAGQMILPVALCLFWLAADRQGRAGWKISVLAVIAAAGMSLTYYRMPYYYVAFVLPWLLFYPLINERWDKRRGLGLLLRVASIGILTLILILPWAMNMLGGHLVANVSAGVDPVSALEKVRADYLAWRDIALYVPRYLVVLSAIGLVWSLVRHRWKAFMLALWTVVLASLVAAQLIGLPGATHLQNYAILIALYLPVGLMVGDLLAGGVVLVNCRWGRWGEVGVSLVILTLALFGFRERMAVLDPDYALVTGADEVAMEWIQANTPPDATFLVNGFLIYQGSSAVGSDTGWWIPLLAGRDNTMPPQYALFNEAEAVPGYGWSIVSLVAALGKDSPTTAAGLENLCEFGVTHVYVGQGQGRVARETLDPYLVPADLVASPHFQLLYHQDRVWIFAVKDDACP